MKKVIITGTSRGIGFELTKIFADKNYQVLALSRNISTLKKINHPNIKAISVDLTKEKEILKISKYLENNWKHIDILINNAGILLNKPFCKTSTQDFMDVYKVNVFAAAELTRISIPFLSVGSHVVSISSMGGVQGSVKFSGLSAYSSSKGALITLTEMLAEEYKHHKISFNALAIGAVQTDMLSEVFPNYKAPLKPFEMATYIFNFATTGNKYYNGKVLHVSVSTP